MLGDQKSSKKKNNQKNYSVSFRADFVATTYFYINYLTFSTYFNDENSIKSLILLRTMIVVLFL